MKLHFHRELADLNTEIARLGGLVEESIGKALTSLRSGDKKLAKEVRKGDDLIDVLEVELEERLLKILALYHPVAKDLRFIVAVLKVNNELEHMGDLTESIAQKIKRISPSQVQNTPMRLFEMGEITQKMVGLALDSLLTQDVEKAKKVIQMDDEVDRLHREHHQLVSQHIEEKSEAFSLSELGLLSVSRSLERIADMATSVAEDVFYLVEAKIVRHRNEPD
jgi:phosphate transport system protein